MTVDGEPVEVDVFASAQGDAVEDGAAVGGAEDDGAAGGSVAGGFEIAVVAGGEQQGVAGLGGGGRTGEGLGGDFAGAGVGCGARDGAGSGAQGTFGGAAVGVGELQTDFVLGVGLQIEEAAGMFVDPVEDGAGADALARGHAPERHGVMPGGFAGAAVVDFDHSVEVVVAGDLPLEGEVDEGGIGHGDFAGDGGVFGEEGESRGEEDRDEAHGCRLS